MRRAGFLLIFLLGMAGVGPVAAQPGGRDIKIVGTRPEKRLALVIGNGAYSTSPLRNPVNDARGVAEALRGAGFEVKAYENITYKEMRRAILEFGNRLDEGAVGLFYFAGHGIQAGGRNYLIPTDAAIASEREVEVESVDVASVLARMETAKTRVNIVILDACRNNPFGRSFRSSAQGLAAIDAPSGTLLAYATAPGKVARDGDRDHGLYTGELLQAMQVPGLKIEEVFKRARQGVQRQTGGEQVPWESSSLVGDFVFSQPNGAGAEVQASASAAPAPPSVPAPPAAPPSPSVGILTLRGAPAGAIVLLDGHDVGRLGPKALRLEVPPASYSLRVDAPGYISRESRVEVKANAEQTVNLELEPLVAAQPTQVGGPQRGISFFSSPQVYWTPSWGGPRFRGRR